MSKKVLAVADSDEGYVDRFMKYVKKKRKFSFTAVGFTSLNSMSLYLERNHVDVLLVSEELADEKGLRKLKELSGELEVLIAGERQQTETRQKYINRYRAADRILSDIAALCTPETYEENAAGIFELDMTAVFSPVCTEERQSFALAAAGVLANDRNVLFLSFDRFSGLRESLKIRTEYSLSDLIFYYKTNPKRIREILPLSTFRTGQFDLIPAPDHMEDIDLIEDEKWGAFLKTLLDAGSYDEILLDMGDAFRKPEVLFSLSKDVFVPMSSAPLAKERLEELYAYLTDREEEKFRERFTEVELPEQEDPFVSDGNYLQRCFNGVMAKTAEEAYYRRSAGS